jgi:hypothetical protein
MFLNGYTLPGFSLRNESGEAYSISELQANSHPVKQRSC